MTSYRCSCGYAPARDDDLADHLGEMLVPLDDKGSDGQLVAHPLGH